MAPFGLLSFNVLEVLAGIILACGLPVYIVNHVDDYLGKGGFFGVIKLWMQGSVKIGSWSASALEAQDIVLQDPPDAGKRHIAGAEKVRIESTLWRIVTGHTFVVHVGNPWLDLTSNDSGQLHLTRLLQEVGLMREVKADRQPEPVSASAGTIGEEAHKGTVSINMAAQVRVSTAMLSLEEGRLTLSEDIGAVFGDNMFIQAAIGEAHVKAALEGPVETDEDWYERRNWPEPAESTGQPLYPLVVDAMSDHISMRVQGWRTTTGVLLQRAIKAHVDFSPALASLMLAKVHPLLGAAVGLDRGERITASLMPLEGHHPAEVWSVRLEPMKMGMETKGLLKGIMNLLQIKSGGGLKQPQRLEAWASQLEADLYKSGLIVSKRLDVLIGSNVDSGKGIHIAMWGRVDAEHGNACAMTLGIPATTLAGCGLLSDLPSDYVFPIKVGGTAHKPVVDWIGATRELTELLLQHRVSKDLPCLGPFLQRTMTRMTRSNDKPKAPVPPLLCPLPWEY